MWRTMYTPDNPKLLGINPNSVILTDELKLAIGDECKSNILYFLQILVHSNVSEPKLEAYVSEILTIFLRDLKRH